MFKKPRYHSDYWWCECDLEIKESFPQLYFYLLTQKLNLKQFWKGTAVFETPMHSWSLLIRQAMLRATIWILHIIPGLPGGSDSKESACNVGDPGLIPGSERFPEEGNGYPLQYSCFENSMNRGGWLVTVHGSKRIGHSWANKHSMAHLLKIFKYNIWWILRKSEFILRKTLYGTAVL